MVFKNHMISHVINARRVGSWVEDSGGTIVSFRVNDLDERIYAIRAFTIIGLGYFFTRNGKVRGIEDSCVAGRRCSGEVH